jgi:CheY-like chemotaxis protein
MTTKKTILLIDDHEPTLDSAKEILEEKGFLVHAFRHFEEAVHFLNKQKPNLIISDLMGHTKVNGLQFFIEQVWYRNIPFSLLTGSLNNQEIRERSGVGRLLKNASENSIQKGHGTAQSIHISFDKEKMLLQEPMDITVENTLTHNKVSFRVFPKPTSLDAILKYHGML